jgi:hypothetical protein
MQPSFIVAFAVKGEIFRDSGQTTPVILALAGSPRSACQLGQLVGEQGNDAKHEMKADFRSSPHHHVAGPKPFFQPAFEPLGHGPRLIAHHLMGGQGNNLLPPAIFFP